MQGGVDNKHCGTADADAVRGYYWNLESPGIRLGKEAGDLAGGHRGLSGVRGYRKEPVVEEGRRGLESTGRNAP